MVTSARPKAVRTQPPFGAAGGVREIACQGAQIRSSREPDPLGHAESSACSAGCLYNALHGHSGFAGEKWDLAHIS